MIGANQISAVPIGAGAPATDGAAANIVATLVGPKQTLTFTATRVITSANASLTAPAPNLVAGTISIMSANLTAPSPLLSAFSGASAEVLAPLPILRAFTGADIDVSAPTAQLFSEAHDSTGEWAANLTAPKPTLYITTGAHALSLAPPTATVSCAGTVTIVGQAALAAPAGAITSAGTTASMLGAALIAPSPNLVGYSGAVCSVTITGHATLTATGTAGAIGDFALTCPLFELTAGATLQATASADLIAPSPEMGRTAQAWLTAPGAQLTAIGSAVITATYEAYATNLKHNPRPGVEPHDEVTHYTNFPFTHVVRYQNSYYGANSTGLYLLEGTTDDVTPIPWNWKTATTDFKSPQNKTVASAYFGGRLGPADTITLHAGEGAKVQAYSYTTPRGALAQNYRQAFGKGIKSHRYYALEASGTGELALDDISLDVHNLSRRI